MVVEVRGKVVEVRVEESKMRMAVVGTRSLLPSSLLPSFLPFVPSRSSWLLFLLPVHEVDDEDGDVAERGAAGPQVREGLVAWLRSQGGRE